MKPETIEEQTLYLYNHLADNIEWGVRDCDSDLESFSDHRGGFISPLMWSERYVKNELEGKNYQVASELLAECRVLLKGVQRKGWTSELKKNAKDLIVKLRGQEWL